jgi:hypothetical protein
MKTRHRIPVERLRLTDVVTPAYQAEVDATTAKAEVRERKAQRALAAAERRLAKAAAIKQPTRQQHHDLLVARELVEMRRQELLAIQRGMQTAPASSAHRTRAMERPIPQQHIL